MKKHLLVLAAAFVCLALGGNSFAGVCINIEGGFCNHYYFSLTKTESAEVFALTGYEYGCGQVDRIASGTARVEGGQVHVGFTGSNGASAVGDYGQLVEWNATLDLPSITGTYVVMYSYLSSGVPDGHGASGDVSVTLCPDPGLEFSPGGPDLTLRGSGR